MARGGATGASSTSHVVWSWPLARCRHSAEEPGAVPSAAGWIRVGLLSNHELGKGYSNGTSRLQQADDLRRTRHDPLQQLVRRRQSQASGPGAADRRWNLHACAIRRRGARLAGVGGFAPLSIFGFRDHGARAVGIAGGPEKCAYVKNELRFDAAIDHRAADFPAQLAGACSDGIDVYFENVGGAIWQAVLPLLNNFARVSVSGLIAQYNGVGKGDGTDRLPATMRLPKFRPSSMPMGRRDAE